MNIEVRRLVPGDEAALEAFLKPHLAFSMLLLGNLRRSGLENAARPYHGLYVAAIEDGEIAGVVAHYWNGNLVLQAPRHTAELAQAALQASGSAFMGMLGPDEQAREVRRVLPMPVEQVQLDSREYLYNLPLSDLRLPELLASGGAHTRKATAVDLEPLAEWRMAYNHEAVGDEDTPENRQGSRRQVERTIADERLWVLEIDGRLSAMTGFNADIGEAVQVGGVYTPPELRGRGYARAVVAASLLDARRDGAHTAVLFTQEDNYAAQKAYLSLGFQYLGDYRLLLMR